MRIRNLGVSDVFVSRWRVGRSVGRTVYAQVGDKPGSDDVLIGVMDSRALAALVVASVNAARGFR